jgi:hypothetical protein
MDRITIDLIMVLFGMIGAAWIYKGAASSEYWPVGRNEAVRRMLAKDQPARRMQDQEESEMERSRR